MALIPRALAQPSRAAAEARPPSRSAAGAPRSNIVAASPAGPKFGQGE